MTCASSSVSASPRIGSMSGTRSARQSAPFRRDGAHVAEARGVDLSGLYCRQLVCFRRVVEVRAQVRPPREVSLDEATSDLLEYLTGTVEPFLARPPRNVGFGMQVSHFVASVVRPPAAASLQPRALPRARGVGEARQCPLGCCRVDTVPRELYNDKGPSCAEKADYLVQGTIDVLYVVQRQDRHDIVERSRLGELLYPEASKDRAFGSPGVDGGDGVAGAVESMGQISLPASHLQHPGGRVTDLMEDEPHYAPLPPGGLTHATGRSLEM